MKTTSISVDALATTIDNELKLYSETIMKGVKKEAKKSMRQLVQDTKATAPVGRRKKHYRDSITSKTFETPNTISCIWHVRAPDYRLTHLLENGHALRQGGRAKGTKFLQKASEPIVGDFLNKVEDIIKNG